jgi:hypothetical protein
MTIFFGEPSGKPIASQIFKRHMSPDLAALNLPQQKMLAIDMYPVMVKRFNFTFDRDLDAEELFDFFATHLVEIEYSCETTTSVA